MSLAQLSDRAEVLEVVARLAAAIDDKDWTAVADCFTPDAEVRFGGRAGHARGGAEAAEILRRTLASLDASQHLLGSAVVRLRGDEAEHIGYVHAQHLRAGELYAIGARYEDGLRRTPDGWRLSRRAVFRMWKSGDPEVIRPETS